LQRYREARPHFERALALDDRRLAASPDNRSAKLDSAIDYGQLAGLLDRLGDTPQALTLLRKSMAIRQELADSDPEDVLTRGLLGSVRDRVAGLELKSGRASEAVALAKLAVGDLEFVSARTKADRDLDALRDARHTLANAERASRGAR
jgi:tetratricopeptide (TPR) repeat protein